MLAAALGLLPAIAAAQATPASTDAPAATPAQAPAAAPATPGAGDTAAPASSATPAPVIPATGYGWSTTPKKHTGHGPARAMRSSKVPDTRPDVVLPGFETLADGSSRLFVELSKPVAYDTKAAAGTITYVLKGVHVDKRNNYNPLVTVHFNTPVTSARLVPHGKDMWFVVDLRSNVQPTVAMDAAKDGAAMLRIEFAKGDYLPAESSEIATGMAPAMGTGAPASTGGIKPAGAAPAPRPVVPAQQHHHRGGRSQQQQPQQQSPPVNPSTL
jgi:hypothetical protein